jgi:magnesium transporter
MLLHDMSDTQVLQGLGSAEREHVATLRAQGRFFWLDASLRETRHEDLAETLAIPPRALGALQESSPASVSRILDADGESVFFALRCYVRSDGLDDGAAYRLRPVEVRLVVTSEYLLTVHDEQLSLPAALAPGLPGDRGRGYVLYSVLDAMSSSSFDALGEVELRLDRLAASWIDGGRGGAPGWTVRAAAARLAAMRRAATAQLDLFERLGVEVAALPGFASEDEAYFDRLYEQVNRFVGSVDAAANAVGMLLDLQLNERAYLVSVVATIFVPLTFITGFFGMNFGWMVGHVDSPAAFWAGGVGVPLVTALLSWRFLVRRLLAGHGRT